MTSKKALTPPAAVAANARKGLALREEFHRGGTAVGIKRAEGLASRQPISEQDAGRIARYFTRHEVDKKTHTHKWGSEKDPSAGYIAWLLWGGNEGRTWAKDLKTSLEKGKAA